MHTSMLWIKDGPKVHIVAVSEQYLYTLLVFAYQNVISNSARCLAGSSVGLPIHKITGDTNVSCDYIGLLDHLIHSFSGCSVKIVNF